LPHSSSSFSGPTQAESDRGAPKDFNLLGTVKGSLEFKTCDGFLYNLKRHSYSSIDEDQKSEYLQHLICGTQQCGEKAIVEAGMTLYWTFWRFSPKKKGQKSFNLSAKHPDNVLHDDVLSEF
jgi:hypothetical protein